MTQTFGVNANNDMYVGRDGNLVVVRNLDAVLQYCQQVARTILGEMVLQTDQGIPYFEVVFVGVPNIPQFETALRAAWLQVAHVVRVVSLVTQQIGNTFEYTAVIMTDYGQGTING